ncbi:hypothetical protein DK843_08265 [Chromobacterium phragmitis]|uniref:Uncharacterized protein n=1 Tax=Chromobacterium phragmitis TaxID=2202141 RepID=A0A344UDZ4_9NEIS|nr:hypothetical protein DK843_03670 [Chromobacterium phragmitis]AXE34288.1 hypothetical protein DK843_08265 [Chromobacterium phragmitis]
MAWVLKDMMDFPFYPFAYVNVTVYLRIIDFKANNENVNILLMFRSCILILRLCCCHSLFWLCHDN